MNKIKLVSVISSKRRTKMNNLVSEVNSNNFMTEVNSGNLLNEYYNYLLLVIVC